MYLMTTGGRRSALFGAAMVLAGLTAPALAQPTLDDDLGALTNGVTVVRTGNVGANVAPHWYRFTVPALPAASGAGHLYLDIRTTNASDNASFVSSSIGLYDAAGNLATGDPASSVDRNDGPGIGGGFTGGALSYGATCPTRPNTATPPATVSGTLFNGRDGALPAGTYYLAFMRDGGTYGASDWQVLPVTVGTSSGEIQIEITLGTTGNPPPILTASAANPPAVNSGGASLLTVTSGSCNVGDVPTSMTINLGSIGGSTSAAMYNDGTHGDVTPGDAVWSLSTPVTAAPGTYILNAIATNVHGLVASRDVTVVVNAAPNLNLKISQVNGTGSTQNSWSGPTASYVELHNTGASAADLTGYAVQVTFSTGTSWGVVPFPAGFTIPAGGYALVQVGNARTPNNDPNNPSDSSATQSPGFLITPDVVGSPPFVLASSGGKVALTSTQAALTGTCPSSDPSIVDLLGYGAATCSEGAVAIGLSNFDGAALYRGCLGSGDSGNNSADFQLGPSSPRNLASPVNTGSMTAVGAPAGASLPTVVQNSAVLLTASASSCAGAPSGVQFAANLSFVGGPASAPMYDDGTHGDVQAGDGTFSLSYTVPDSLLPAPPPGPAINRPYVVPMTGTDALGRQAHTFASFYVTAAPTGACCVNGQGAIRTEAACAALGGVYLGNDSSPFSGQGTPYVGDNIFIPNPGTGTGTITIPDATTIDQMVVYLNGYHAYLGDMICTLSNGTTSVTLFNRVGVANNNATGRPGNLVNGWVYGWTDVGGSFWNAAYNGGKDSNYNEPAGLYAPSGPGNAASSFAPFIGQSAQGTWTLTATDASVDNFGFLWSWTIAINPPTACSRCGSADFNGDGDTGTDADIEAFFACLAGSCCATCGSADFNFDGDTGTDADIEAFFRVLAGGSC
jgi:subtilisin-like proprotein convertase family protein